MNSFSRTLTNGRLQDLLGIKYPIIQGPFGGGLSSVSLVTAVAEAGGLGSFGANTIAPENIPALVDNLKNGTSRPFAVNLWVPLPGESDLRLEGTALSLALERLRPYLEETGVPAPDRLPHIPGFAAQCDALLHAAPPVISFVMGIPSPDILAEARRRGIVTLGTATTVDEAVALERAGVDAIVASGSDGGGHRGSFLQPVQESLVGTFSLVPQVADAVTIPVIAAGGIADGRGIAAALALGADGVQIGTGFLATEESGASTVHKQSLHGSQARTTVLTRVFSGRTARAIPNRFLREMSIHEDHVPPYPLQNALTLPIRHAAGNQGLADYVNLWAGQAAPLARSQHAGDYFRTLLTETERALARRS